MKRDNIILSIEEEHHELMPFRSICGASIMEFLDVAGYFTPSVRRQFPPVSDAELLTLCDKLVKSDVPYATYAFEFLDSTQLDTLYSTALSFWRDKNLSKGRAAIPMDQLNDAFKLILDRSNARVFLRTSE